jgi:hypothetical protein
MYRKTILATVILALATSAAMAQNAAQSQTGSDVQRGFVSFAEFGGSMSSSGHVIKLDTSAGYNLSEHFGVDFGVPFYFAGGTNTASTGAKVSSSATGLSAPYFAVRAMYKDEEFGYAGRFAVLLPSGGNNGLSTGNTSFDWNNHFENKSGRFTPYGEIGVANTVLDSAKYNRPFSTFGDNFHVEGGANVDVTDKVSVGGSGFDIFPWGTQAIYSRVLPKGSFGAGNANSVKHGRAFEQNSYTIGSSDLGKDKGASAWVDFMPAPYVTVEAAYTHSIQYALNTASFSMRLDIGYLSRHRAGN